MLALTLPGIAFGQANYANQASEYPIAGALPGDQVYPQVSVKASGGYVVWQDAFTDGDGLGISARRLDNTLSGTLSAFRVNQIGTADQENPRVAMLNNGGAVFVWQGGKQSFQNIYARFLSSSNTWVGGDILVNTFTNSKSGRLTPVVATLTNGNVIVVWASLNQAVSNSMQDVYGQLLSPTGQKIGGEFLINQFTTFNQRTPTVAALAGGGFVVAWVSEQQRSGNVDANGGTGTYVTYTSISNRPSVDIYARLYSSSAAPLGNEFLVNTGADVCANPRLAAAGDGTFMVVWGQKDLQNFQNSWDVFARSFSSTGTGGTVRLVNTQTFGDQYLPQITALGTDYLVVWTSLGQDGAREGVFGQFLRSDGTPSGGEFRVNTTTAGQQMHQAVAADGSSRFLVVWTSFVGGGNGFDLYAQRYSLSTQPLTAMAAPFVTVLSSNALTVSWPPQAGFNISAYEIYADGAASPTSSTTNCWWTMSGLAPGSTHSFQVDYLLADGRRSPLSVTASGTTYSTLTWGGIPYDWMTSYFGTDVSKWPSPYADSDGDGVSNLNEFLAGTDPTSANSVLKIQLQSTKQGLYLNWNTQAGLIYQVQTSSDLKTWVNAGGQRFAAGALDSMYVGGGAANYYRVLRIR